MLEKRDMVSRPVNLDAYIDPKNGSVVFTKRNFPENIARVSDGVYKVYFLGENRLIQLAGGKIY
ncbi:MAG TPA: hypothetical protein VHA30_04230, partial [Patescibacteria group bacterium]|nr:hypothetical protein [Patescibacteria group bacterium]